MELAIMIEGQNGLNWPRWQRMVQMVEDLGFDGLFRSDHFTNANPPDMDSLDLWISLTWLADHTKRIHFGPLVSPVSFRHPTHTARMASAVDDLSAGRLVLGLGAGWQEREHAMFGWDLLPVQERLDRFEEGLEVITGLLTADKPLSFDGKYYQLREAALHPRPNRSGGPPILIGGNGTQRTLPLVARYASEWNGVMVNPAKFSQLNKHLDDLLAAEGRNPREVRRSIMVNLLAIGDVRDVETKLSRSNRTLDDYRRVGAILGTPSEIVDQLGAFSEAGAYRVMLQYLDLDNLRDLETLAVKVLPQVKDL